MKIEFLRHVTVHQAFVAKQLPHCSFECIGDLATLFVISLWSMQACLDSDLIGAVVSTLPCCVYMVATKFHALSNTCWLGNAARIDLSWAFTISSFHLALGALTLLGLSDNSDLLRSRFGLEEASPHNLDPEYRPTSCLQKWCSGKYHISAIPAIPSASYKIVVFYYYYS